MDQSTPDTTAPSSSPARTPKAIWGRLGGQLGVGLCALGFLVVFLGWNGAASSDRIPSQFPYLISGGVLGLCFVVLGVGMLVVQNQRADRAALQATLRELQEALERAGLAEGTGGQRRPFAKPGPRPGLVPDQDLTQEIAVPAEAPDLEPVEDEPAPRGNGRARRTRSKPLQA
jgi:hypothetical protein